MQKSHNFLSKIPQKEIHPNWRNMKTSLFSNHWRNPPSFFWESHPKKTSATWWFQIFFMFTPTWWRWSNLTHIFQRGWFNHQLENLRITSRPRKRRSKISPSYCVERPCSDSCVRRSWRWHLFHRIPGEVFPGIFRCLGCTTTGKTQLGHQIFPFRGVKKTQVTQKRRPIDM